MRIIEGMENSVLIVFLIIMSFILYIFWNMLKYIMEKQNIRGQDPYEINRNANSQSDPYANSGLHEECSICTERVQYKVELDCSHSFCGKCIMEYYDSIHSNGLKCPLCRNEVRLINNEKIIRDDNTKDFYDKIVIFNHRHINGMNFVLLPFLLYSTVAIFLISAIFFIEESEVSSTMDCYYFISLSDWE